MSRTHKDAPAWVRAMRVSPQERYEYHAHGCERSDEPRSHHRTTVRKDVIGTERVRKTFIKMVDGNHLFFGAEVHSAPLYHHRAGSLPAGTVCVDGGRRYYVDYDEKKHPDAKPVERDLPYPKGYMRFIAYSKVVEVPVIAETYAYEEIERGTHPCELEGKQVHGSRDSCSAYPRTPHRCDSTKEMRREGYTAPERAHVRDVLRAAVHDYNTHGETEIEPVNRQPRRGPWGGGYWD